MFSDAHLHLVDLEKENPGFFSRLPSRDWIGAVAAHDAEEFERSELLRSMLPKSIAGFGIHPQAPREDTMDLLAENARSGKIAFIGEAGFDFFGDIPERQRTASSIEAQRKAFEYQLKTAQRYNLPLLIHIRKATDILMGYAGELKKLPSVIFHGWPGRLIEANTFLLRGVPAYFSFGTTLLRGASHALESLKGLPLNHILSETDAPWQRPLGMAYTDLSCIIPIVKTMALARKIEEEQMQFQLRENFAHAFITGA
jgi:TatD DNase family protein